MRSHWTQQEENILALHYTDKGAIGCIHLLSRTQKAICKKARKLGLFTKTTLGGTLSKKHIIKQFNSKRGIVTCSQHGDTIHYLSNSRSPVCLLCRRGWDKKRSQKLSRKLQINLRQRQRYKEPINNYTNRLRRILRFCSHGKISFSKHLPYSAKQLCHHLENIRKQQGNCCPMCHISYNITGYDIDHICPIMGATNKDELLLLFRLKNLSLLCQPCNRHIKRDMDIKARRQRGEIICH